MDTWVAQYKCRKCGKVFDGCTAGDYYVALENTYSTICGTKSGDPLQPHMHTTHFCDKFGTGDIGIADFIGWKFRKEN